MLITCTLVESRGELHYADKKIKQEDLKPKDRKICLLEDLILMWKTRGAPTGWVIRSTLTSIPYRSSLANI